MTTNTSPPSARVLPGEIADLTAWARRLTQAGPGHADPAELAAYLAAKTDLLTRITDHNTHQSDTSDDTPQESS